MKLVQIGSTPFQKWMQQHLIYIFMIVIVILIMDMVIKKTSKAYFITKSGTTIKCNKKTQILLH